MLQFYTEPRESWWRSRKTNPLGISKYIEAVSGSGVAWAAKKVGRLEGYFREKCVLTLFLYPCQALLLFLRDGHRAKRAWSDQRWLFLCSDVQVGRRSHTLGAAWAVQACQAGLNTGDKKQLRCKTALRHWVVNGYWMLPEQTEQQRKYLQWKNGQLKAAQELKHPGNRRVLNSTSLCRC